MPHLLRNSFRALSIGCAAMFVTLAPGVAQTNAPASTQAAPAQEADQARQVDLTEKQIEGVLAAQKDFDALAEKAPESTTDTPDPKVSAQFDAAARKYGFANYDEYSDVLDTISLVLGGFDPKTKQYIGTDGVIKQQIAAIEADKSIPDDDRKQALDQLNDALKAPAPPIRNKANIDLVAKYYDRLSAAIQQDE